MLACPKTALDRNLTDHNLCGKMQQVASEVSSQAGLLTALNNRATNSVDELEGLEQVRSGSRSNLRRLGVLRVNLARSLRASTFQHLAQNCKHRPKSQTL